MFDLFFNIDKSEIFNYHKQTNKTMSNEKYPITNE